MTAHEDTGNFNYYKAQMVVACRQYSNNQNNWNR